MANVAHSSLADPDVHEPKGASTATSGQVYASNGAGSGAWKKLDNTNLGPLGNPFGSNLIQVTETQASGVTSSNATGGGLVTRTLNTVNLNQIAGASLSSNQITLPAGTYLGWFGAAPTQFTTGVQSDRQGKGWLYDVTHSAALVIGACSRVDTPSSMGFPTTLTGFGSFVLSGSSLVEFRHYSGIGYLENPASVVGISEIYSTVMIWRVA